MAFMLYNYGIFMTALYSLLGLKLKASLKDFEKGYAKLFTLFTISSCLFATYETRASLTDDKVFFRHLHSFLKFSSSSSSSLCQSFNRTSMSVLTSESNSNNYNHNNHTYNYCFYYYNNKKQQQQQNNTIAFDLFT